MRRERSISGRMSILCSEGQEAIEFTECDEMLENEKERMSSVINNGN